MSEVEVTSATASPVQYTITYSLFLDGASIASIDIDKDQTNTPQTARNFAEIPNLTWVNSPLAAAHTYEIRITVTGTNISSAAVLTRALNIVRF